MNEEEIENLKEIKEWKQNLLRLVRRSEEDLVFSYVYVPGCCVHVYVTDKKGNSLFRDDGNLEPDFYLDLMMGVGR